MVCSGPSPLVWKFPVGGISQFGGPPQEVKNLNPSQGDLQGEEEPP